MPLLIPIFNKDSDTATGSDGTYAIYTARAGTFACYNISTSGYTNGGGLGSMFDDNVTTGVDFEKSGTDVFPYRIIITLPVNKTYTGPLSMNLVAPWVGCMPKTATLNTYNGSYAASTFTPQTVTYLQTVDLGQIGDANNGPTSHSWNLSLTASFNMIVIEILSGWGSSGRFGTSSNSVWITSISFGTDYESTFTSHTFTNAGATGRTGPTLSAVRTAYSNAMWAQDTTNNWLNMSGDNGIQLWTVPKTGSYTIEAYGAQGGNADTATGGLGARIKISTSLIKNDIIKILCGQQGGTASIASAYDHPAIAGGGGGGTYIYNVTTTSIILIAGGGGGAAKGNLTSTYNPAKYVLNGGNASAYNETSGTDGKSSTAAYTYGKGGTDGNAGTTGSGGGSSGAGWKGSGVKGTYGGGVGLSFNSGGTGGENIVHSGSFVINTEGGFGGGSGAGVHQNYESDAGGGGGYSGGGGGGQVLGTGGGGGNYMIAGSTYISSGTNTNHGKVIITLLTTTPATLTFLKTAFYAKNVLNSTITLPATDISTNNTDTVQTVTHTSGSTGVATVTTSANVGTVTVKGLGTTTITSTLAATANFDAVTVTSITITVVGSGSIVTGATMTSVDLSETNLTGTVFSGCDLTSANLYGATFNENTDLRGSTLTSLKSGRINGFTTLLPAGYKMI
jgi:hypothetical protein